MIRDASFIVTIDDERRELFALAAGVITLDAIRAHLDEERAAGALAYRELIDARYATPALSPADLRELVALLRHEAAVGRQGPTAIVVASDDAFGMMHMLALMLDDVLTMRVFRDFAEAVDWLATLPARELEPRRRPDMLH